MNAMFPLRGVVKQYDWGGSRFIADLLADPNSDQKPYAEYWMGTHPQGMSHVETANEQWTPVNSVAGELSFLYKVLDVSSMLSIQVHPSKEAARFDFARENQMGIALDAPHRNYKDANHKPELMVALSPFWLLHGFKEPALLKQTLTRVEALQFLLPVFEQGGYEALYRRVMEMPQQEVDRRLQGHIDTLLPLYRAQQLAKDDPDFWAARAALAFSQNGSVDRGIFSIYLYNLVRLGTGEAIFQDAGIPHAYLEGQNVEIMANSDNVLRGGLTSKHIDVGELIKHVRFEPVIPQVLHAAASDGSFAIPVDDFSLRQLLPGNGSLQLLRVETPSILLCMQGSVELAAGGSTILLKQGQPAALLMPGHDIAIKALCDGLLFIATTGIHMR